MSLQGRIAVVEEHVRSENPVMGKIMDALNPLVVRMAGANINRHTVDNVRAAGFGEVAASSHMGGIVRLIEARP